MKAAPWYVDVHELQSFDPLEVWDQFRTVFPVLAVYRRGWVSAVDVAQAPPDMDQAQWSDLWTQWRARPDAIGTLLRWPPAVMDVCSLLLPLCRLLWAEEPWLDWFPPTADPETVPRAIVPLLRRAACLCHGFHLGGCSPRGVWEAIALPNRLPTM